MRVEWLYVILFAILIGSGVAMRNWQCAEMFPDANRLACLVWK